MSFQGNEIVFKIERDGLDYLAMDFPTAEKAMKSIMMLDVYEKLIAEKTKQINAYKQKELLWAKKQNTMMDFYKQEIKILKVKNRKLKIGLGISIGTGSLLVTASLAGLIYTIVNVYGN